MELADFAGCWTLDRRIEDHRAAWIGAFLGTAEFVPDETLPDGIPPPDAPPADVPADCAGLRYREAGLLNYGPGPPIRASREYLWRRAGPGRIAVLFADGRAFHAFSARRTGEPEAAHLCGTDLYRVRYDFSRWPNWTADWRVAGPSKDYRLVSRYAPARDGTCAAADLGAEP